MSLDSDDISRLYETYGVNLLRFFARRTLQPEVALDLVAETFAQAFADRAQFRGQGDEAAIAWIFGIARHLLGKYFRSGRVERRALQRLGLALGPVSEADYERVEELVGLQGERAALAEALAGLSTALREAVRLRVVEELSYRELAAQLGISEPAARVRVSRALRALMTATEQLQERPGHA